MSNLEQRLGKSPGSTETRRANLSPESYDAQERTVRAILSAGASVKRMYGTEVLQITPSAVNLDRLQTCGVPLIDSHNIFGLDGVLGNLERAWFKDKQLLGLIRFDDGDAGRQAEGLVARGAVRGVSIGYRVDQWEVRDEDGNIVDPERERLLFDENYTFTAKRWELLEVSIVSVPADPAAFIRSAARATPPTGNSEMVRMTRVRMRARARMMARQRVFVDRVIDRL